MKKYFSQVIFLFVFISFAKAQSVQLFNTSNSPLTDNTVRSIKRDSTGTMWICTDYGLCTYNAGTWAVYTTANSGLPDNAIRTVAFDKLGNTWIGTANGGLVKYDGTTYTVYDIFNSGIPDNSVKCIAFDTAGVIWVGTIGGLGRFDGTNWTTFNMFNSGMVSSNVAGLFFDVDNTLYAGTINGGLSIFKSDTLYTTLTYQNSFLPDNTVLDILKDTNNILWLAMPANGITAFINGISFVNYSTTSSGIASNSLNDFEIDDKNNIWMASLDSGVLYKYGISFLSYNTSNIPTFSDNSVLCVTCHAGEIWAGTSSNGIVVFTPFFTSIAEEELAHTTLFPNPCVNFVQLTSNKEIKAISIYNTAGMRLPANSSFQNELSLVIDMSKFTSGVYFIHVSYMHGGQQLHKIIKQ
ncbi:MAG: T9SS type A sorting domain-containing protein [Bacteroidetes bacterium]|nr:T9SS type A sorting domain-containing protein [Bacteroidota bacterium]